MQDYIRRAAAMPIRQVPREELGPLRTFTIPIKARSGPLAVGNTTTEMRNTFFPLAPLGTGIEGRDNKSLSLSSFSGASVILLGWCVVDDLVVVVWLARLGEIGWLAVMTFSSGVGFRVWRDSWLGGCDVVDGVRYRASFRGALVLACDRMWRIDVLY